MDKIDDGSGDMDGPFFVVGGLLTVLIGLLSGGGAGAIANSKGRSFGGYFLLGFFFPMIGLLIAIGMPSLRPVAAVRQSAQGHADRNPLEPMQHSRSGSINGPDRDTRAVVAKLPDTKAAAIEHLAEGFRSFTKMEVEEFSDSFKIFLADHYGIQRHEVLGEFAFREKLYPDLETALRASRDAYVLDTDRLRQIKESDWAKTRQEIQKGTYVCTEGRFEVASIMHGDEKIVLWSDGAFEVIAKDQASHFYSSWNEVQAFALFGNDTAAFALFRNGATIDPLTARRFLESRGYKIDDLQVGRNLIRRIWTPEDTPFESGGRDAFDPSISDQILVKLAIDVARSDS